MNKTVLTIVQTDSRGNDAKFTVTGERNGLFFLKRILYMMVKFFH